MTSKDVSNRDLAKMIENLAVSSAKGFERVDGKLDGLQNQISGVNNRIDDLALNRATKDEIYHLGLRVSKIEHKIGFSKR